MDMSDAISRTLDFLGLRGRAYQITFPKSGAAQAIVLKDLAMFCHINEECPHTDPLKIGEWLGRRAVFLRFQRHLYLSPEELFAIYAGVRTQTKEN